LARFLVRFDDQEPHGPVMELGRLAIGPCDPEEALLLVVLDLYRGRCRCRCRRRLARTGHGGQTALAIVGKRCRPTFPGTEIPVVVHVHCRASKKLDSGEGLSIGKNQTKQPRLTAARPRPFRDRSLTLSPISPKKEATLRQEAWERGTRLELRN